MRQSYKIFRNIIILRNILKYDLSIERGSQRSGKALVDGMKSWKWTGRDHVIEL